MRLKKYFISAIILMLAIMFVVFINIDTVYSANIMGTIYSFPMFIWVVIPMFILFLATLGHMMFYGFLNYLKDRSYKSDYDAFIKLVENSMMDNSVKLKFKNSEIEKLATLFENSKIVLNNTEFDTGIDKIDTIISSQRHLKNGDVVKLQNYSLDKDNEYLLSNQLNQVKDDVKFAKEIVKNSQQYAKEVLKEACNTIYATNNKKDILLVLKSDFLNIDVLFDVLNLDEKVVSFDVDEILSALNKLELSTKEYIQLAQLLKNKKTPDSLIGMFENLSNKDENAMESYLYVLLSFEMVDKVRDIINSSDEDDLMIFKAYLSLKDNKKDYDLDKFLLGLL
jgi:hypothetical protein